MNIWKYAKKEAIVFTAYEGRQAITKHMKKHVKVRKETIKPPIDMRPFVTKKQV